MAVAVSAIIAAVLAAGVLSITGCDPVTGTFVIPGTCPYQNDGECDEGTICPTGADTADCGDVFQMTCDAVPRGGAVCVEYLFMNQAEYTRARSSCIDDRNTFWEDRRCSIAGAALCFHTTESSRVWTYSYYGSDEQLRRISQECQATGGTYLGP